METILEHTKLATKLHKTQINLDFVKEFSLQKLDDCCDRIQSNEMIRESGRQDIFIQRELIKNEKFIHYLVEIYNSKTITNGLKTLLADIEAHNEKITDYDINDIINVLRNEKLCYEAYYDYLKYFSNRNPLFVGKITKSLNNFFEQDTVKIEELSSEMLKLFEYDYLANNCLLPLSDIKEVYQLLLENEKLRYLIWFLDYKKYKISLDFNGFLKISNDASDIYEMVQRLSSEIVDTEIMGNLLYYWINNGCRVYDLKIIIEKIKEVDNQNLESIFKTRSGYINFIYGSKLKKFKFDNVNESREKLITYAIINNKKSFLKLIDEHMQEFLEIPTYKSILFEEKFYTKYFNINELTLKKMIKIEYLNNFSNIRKLKEQFYTFEEIEVLSKVAPAYSELYNQLLDLPIDDRLLRIKQCIKKKLLDNVESKDLEKIAERIKEKSIYDWLEDFKFIQDIQVADIIQIFINYEIIAKFIPQLKYRSELGYVIRNVDQIQDYNNLQNISENIIEIDKQWKYLEEQLKFDEEFIQKYQKNIREFILNGNAEIAYSYYVNSDLKTQESYKLIIKAEIMGEFKQLKYHTDDLKEEIDFKLNQNQIDEWTNNNSKISDEIYEIGEYDDFYHTMILGAKPQKTCLNYEKGSYSSCLLSCFDSNKKILYAKMNGKIVGRAMVRLTKGTYKRMDDNKTLSFFDVEKKNSSNFDKQQEKLTIFLERAYFAGISIENEEKVEDLFIKLLEEKAKKMNAELVLSYCYCKGIDENYISKSKASSQYLDSLSGSASISDEGQYRCNTFFIWKPRDKWNSIFDESILIE